MARFSFDIEITSQNENVLAELTERAKNLSVVLDNIITEWAGGNERKFKAGVGAEATGVALDSDVFWEPLTGKYRARKQAQGYGDWLMRATGQLQATMTNPDGFFRAVNESSAIWGTPNSREDEDKLRGNASRRTVVFFDRGDRLAIQREVKNYLSFGEQYKDIMFAQGVQKAEARRAQKLWDVEWNERREWGE